VAITVDYATLHAAASDVRSVQGEVHGELGKLRGAVDMLAGAWQGAAGAGFQTLMQRWNENSDRLMEAMSAIADMLDESGTSHQVTDEEQQQTISRFNSVLNQ
jgi:WXG100 family type VII secretion target